MENLSSEVQIKRLTIFTPTYNRANYLPRLYESLLKQTCKNFVWLIIDDGSVDSSSDIVKGWIADSNIDIQYFYQENKGKHFAYNRAIIESRTELFIDIDSDDFFLENTVERLINLWESVPNKIDYSGIVTLCQNELGNIIGNKFPEDEFISNAFEFRYNHNIWGDKAMLYRTEILKKFSLPEYPCQVVMESILHNRIAMHYKSLCFNEPLVVKEYLSGGLTQSNVNSTFKSLDAKITLFNEMNYFHLNLKLYLFINSRYVKNSLLNGRGINKTFSDAINKRLYFLIAFIIGYFKYRRSLLNL
jgi:glycosyltransferase involved in cell wall biosynthesis